MLDIHSIFSVDPGKTVKLVPWGGDVIFPKYERMEIILTNRYFPRIFYITKQFFIMHDDDCHKAQSFNHI